MSVGLQTFAAILQRAFCGGLVVGKNFSQVKLVCPFLCSPNYS